MSEDVAGLSQEIEKSVFDAARADEPTAADRLAELLTSSEEGAAVASDNGDSVEALLSTTVAFLGKRGVAGIEAFLREKLGRILKDSVSVTEEEVQAVVADINRIKKRLILRYLGFDFRMGEISISDERAFAVLLKDELRKYAKEIAEKLVDMDEIFKEYDKITPSEKRDLRLHVRKAFEAELRLAATDLAKDRARAFAKIYLGQMVDKYVTDDVLRSTGALGEDEEGNDKT